jgi:hypothetical protein
MAPVGNPGVAEEAGVIAGVSVDMGRLDEVIVDDVVGDATAGCVLAEVVLIDLKGRG